MTPPAEPSPERVEQEAARLLATLRDGEWSEGQADARVSASTPEQNRDGES